MPQRSADTSPSEKSIHAAVIAHWRACGLPNTMVATIPNEAAFRQPGLTKGLPDLIVLAPGLPLGFIELKKTAKSIVKPEQSMFGRLCADLGIPYALTIGRDEPINVLVSWGAVRPTR